MKYDTFLKKKSYNSIVQSETLHARMALSDERAWVLDYYTAERYLHIVCLCDRLLSGIAFLMWRYLIASLYV
jgi:hypothetical protein